MFQSRFSAVPDLFVVKSISTLPAWGKTNALTDIMMVADARHARD